jgi:hypothetical protein
MSERDPRSADLARTRAETLAGLEVASVEGRLDPAELRRLQERAKQASSRAELEELLPGAPEERPLPAVAERRDVGPAEDRDTIFALMTGVKRTGSWEPPETLLVYSIMGGVDLDFREAEFLEGVTEVVVTAVMGGVNVIAPPGVDVESSGFALMGDFSHVQHRSPHPDSPVLRIRGLSLMGGVGVKIKK